MRKTRIAQLDRLFARGQSSIWFSRRDTWQPAWKPRGRWWMRASNGAGAAYRAPVASAWRRLARPARAA